MLRAIGSIILGMPSLATSSSRSDHGNVDSCCVVILRVAFSRSLSFFATEKKKRARDYPKDHVQNRRREKTISAVRLVLGVSRKRFRTRRRKSLRNILLLLLVLRRARRVISTDDWQSVSSHGQRNARQQQQQEQERQHPEIGHLPPLRRRLSFFFSSGQIQFNRTRDLFGVNFRRQRVGLLIRQLLSGGRRHPLSGKRS